MNTEKDLTSLTRITFIIGFAFGALFTSLVVSWLIHFGYLRLP